MNLFKKREVIGAIYGWRTHDGIEVWECIPDDSDLANYKLSGLPLAPKDLIGLDISLMLILSGLTHYLTKLSDQEARRVVSIGHNTLQHDVFEDYPLRYNENISC
jgi:hypothetical protein